MHFVTSRFALGGSTCSYSSGRLQDQKDMEKLQVYPVPSAPSETKKRKREDDDGEEEKGAGASGAAD